MDKVTRTKVMVRRGQHGSDDNEEVDEFDDDDTQQYRVDIVHLVFSIILYLADVISDLAVAGLHYKDGHMLYFVLTLFFVVLSSFAVTAISVVWYLTDKQMERTFHSMRLMQPKLNAWRVIALFFQLAPIVRYIDALRYTLAARRFKQASGIEVMRAREVKTMAECEDCAKSEMEDNAFLMIIKAGLQSAPQIVLQMAILLNNATQGHTAVLQGLSLIISFVAVTHAQSSLRSSQQDDDTGQQSCVASVLHNGWIFLITAARITALAIFASTYPEWTVLVCGVHWVIMYTWLVNMDTAYCFDRVFLERLLATATSMAYVYFYVDLLDNPSFWRYFVYNFVQFLENTVLVVLWILLGEPTQWYRYYGPTAHFALYITGIVIQIVYYCHFHPKSQLIRMRRRIPRSWKNLGLELMGQATSDDNPDLSAQDRRISTASSLSRHSR